MYLYKFQRVDKYSIANLLSNSLYFSPSANLNDPTESIFKLELPDEDDKYCPDLASFEKTAILSMASDETNAYELASSLFHWSYYADGLKGFCMIFDKQILIDSFEEKTVYHDSVSYQHTPNILVGDSLITEEWGLEEVPGKNFKRDNFKRLITSAYMNKPDCFSNEKEYRFIKTGDGELNYNQVNALRKVIIGSKISEHDRKLLESVIRLTGQDSKIQYANIRKNRYQIFIENELVI
ncbi:DUF2971 domain-containing protein [Vibrio sp. MA40-2]|uniref:DUF2971 domain-containing protein n=1 Tax=Vibrio sp. MA40-2 TaxID=3391828 RepID=UPI0039A681A6